MNTEDSEFARLEHEALLRASQPEQPADHIPDAGNMVRGCSTDPDAPHGFDRNGSHNNQRYTCDCEGWIAHPAAELPRLPHHPEPHTYTWSKLELEVIADYGKECFTSGMVRPQRQPLTHEQRVDLLTAFEEHKHEWNAHAILIDMVEAAHCIKEKNHE